MAENKRSWLDLHPNELFGLHLEKILRLLAQKKIMGNAKNGL